MCAKCQAGCLWKCVPPLVMILFCFRSVEVKKGPSLRHAPTLLELQKVGGV